MFKKPIWWNGQNLNKVQAFATKFQAFKFRVKRFVRKVVIITFLIGIASGSLYASFRAGQKMFPDIVYAIQEQVVYVTSTSTPPVLQRIAKCESNGSHYDKNGQVIIGKTQDVGKYQIHVPLWGAKATEMGLNLVIEEDNETFAKWLYANYGSEPWIHSKHCWNK